MELHISSLKRLIGAGSIALMLAGTAQAQPISDGGRERGEPGMMPPHGVAFHDEKGGLPPFLRGLTLTDEQRDKVFAILHAQEPLMREQAKAAQHSHTALNTVALSAQFDETKAKALAESEARAMAAMALLHARSDQQLYALLTPAQRKQAEEMKARFESHRQEGGSMEHPSH